MPKKPSRPRGHIVFPKSGAPYSVVEALPDAKGDLEEVIARKFVEALKKRFDRSLAVPIKQDTWPDFWTAEGTRRIGIEVTEVVNPDHVAGGMAYKANQPVSVARAIELLTLAIDRKIAKNYTAPGDAELWLLAYDGTNALAAGHDRAAHHSHAFLESIDHPFSEIWVMQPMTGDLPSFLESVWPTTNFTSMARGRRRGGATSATDESKTEIITVSAADFYLPTKK